MPEFTLELPRPHSAKQAILVNPPTRFNWACAGSKFGKTMGAVLFIIKEVFLKPNRKGRWIAPTYTQAAIALRYIQDMLPPNLYTLHKQKMEIKFLNGTVLQFRSADKPTNLEGDGIHFFVFDEVAKSKKEAYVSHLSTLTQTQGYGWYLSTPFGKNHFYKNFMYAKSGVDPMHSAHHFRTEDNPKVSKEAIETARRTLPPHLFRQYWLAEFLDDSSVFTGFRECQEGVSIAFSSDKEQWFAHNTKERKVVIGVDWAKSVDFTVFTAWDYTEKKLVGYWRFQGYRYPDQIKFLQYFCTKFNRVEIIYHDKTGVGSAIDDMLAIAHLPYEGIVFSNDSKSQMVNDLIMAFQTKELLIPKLETMESELDAYEVTLSLLGKPRYNAPAGLHDDIVSSMLLGWSACLEYASSDLEIKIVEDTAKSDMIDIESYYNKIQREAEDEEIWGEETY